MELVALFVKITINLKKNLKKTEKDSMIILFGYERCKKYDS